MNYKEALTQLRKSNEKGVNTNTVRAIRRNGWLNSDYVILNSRYDNSSDKDEFLICRPSIQSETPYSAVGLCPPYKPTDEDKSAYDWEEAINVIELHCPNCGNSTLGLYEAESIYKCRNPQCNKTYTVAALRNAKY